MKNRSGGTDGNISLVQQYLYESKRWERLLEYIRDENIHYIDRLTEILKNGDDNFLVEVIESFLTKFISEDSVISLFRHDIVEANNRLVLKGKDLLQIESMSKIILTQDKLRQEMGNIERAFNGLKIEFNEYLSGHFDKDKDT